MGKTPLHPIIVLAAIFTAGFGGFVLGRGGAEVQLEYTNMELCEAYSIEASKFCAAAQFELFFDQQRKQGGGTDMDVQPREQNDDGHST